MTGSTIMFGVAAIFAVAGAWMLLQLRSPTITERLVYAYRMVGVMLVSAAIVLAASAAALRSWSMTP